MGINKTITFGWHLDGPSYPENDVLGYSALGPIGLIQELSLRLAMPSQFAPQAVRIAEYMSRLQEIDSGNRFFSQSLQADAWGTSRELLRQRDELVASGLKLITRDYPSQRLNALAEVETLRSGFPACVTDSLSEMIDQLESAVSLPFEQIRLLEASDWLPPIWQRLMGAMEKSRVAVDRIRFDKPDLSTDIGRLAKTVGENIPAVPLVGDSTFMIAEADDEVQAADFVSSFLVNESGRHSTVIIRGGPTSFLDRLLEKSGLPGLGEPDGTPLRAIQQLLPLCLDLLWRPVDPGRVAEFLMMPLSPVPRYAARRFLRALSNEPGIGGDSWTYAWQSALKRKQEFERPDECEQGDVDIQPDDIEKSDWRDWLEPERFEPSSGAPISNIVSLCKRVRSHTLKLYNTRNDEIFARAALDAETLSATLEAIGGERISRSQLERIVESVLSEGNKPRLPQASTWTVVDHPGQICDAADIALWWGFTDRSRQPRVYSWTTDEMSYLSEKNCFPEQANAAILREAKSWRRPLIAPCRKMIVVRPRTAAGRTVVEHPFYHELVRAIENTPYTVRSRLTFQIQQMYGLASSRIFEADINRSPLPTGSLPGPRALWKILPGAVSRRRESPSSLERLLGCPFSWLLRYQAHLKMGDLLSFSEGEQLSGNFAHTVFAKLLEGEDVFLLDDIKETAARYFDEYCPLVAAPLLLPGNSLEREKLRSAICDSAESLILMIREAGFSNVRAEEPVEADMDNLKLFGRPDVLLKHPQLEDFVLDLKWTRRPNYRRRELAEGRSIQLAVYSALSQHLSGVKTLAGYYLVNQRELFSSARSPFPEHAYAGGPPLETTFEALRVNYEHHLRYLESGIAYATGIAPEPSINSDDREVLVDEVDPISPINIPDITLALEPPCRICDFGGMCGKRSMET